MNRQCDTDIKCDSIQSGDTTSGQVYRYQVASVMYQMYIKYPVSGDSMSSVRCQISSVR